MCIAETRTIPSVTPLLPTIPATSSVIRMNSCRFLVVNHRYSVNVIVLLGLSALGSRLSALGSRGSLTLSANLKREDEHDHSANDASAFSSQSAATPARYRRNPAAAIIA